jgi:hypothetical protein
MPKMILRWVVVEEHAAELASILCTLGGRGAMTRAAQLLGVHRDTLMRGIRMRRYGPRVGQKIIDGLRPKYPDIDTKFLQFKCE